jgi:RNA polymerase sigma-70 factor, ECF subfamily
MHDTATIWNDFGDRLRRFIRRRVENDAVAEDLLQDAFLRIHTRIKTLEDQDKIESWIYQVARNAIIDHYRGRRALPEWSEGFSPASIPDEPDAAETLSQSLREMIEALPDSYRQALLLTEYGGLTQAELAAKLGISVSGAKSRVQRARDKIKDALLTCCHFELDRYGRVIDYWEHCCCCARKNPSIKI